MYPKTKGKFQLWMVCKKCRQRFSTNRKNYSQVECWQSKQKNYFLFIINNVPNSLIIAHKNYMPLLLKFQEVTSFLLDNDFVLLPITKTWLLDR